MYKLQAKIPIDHSFDIHDLPDRDKDVNRFMVRPAGSRRCSC
jgi:hypothetical protein